jgi:hypothetical protein
MNTTATTAARREWSGVIRSAAPLLPYLTVGVGLFVLRNAWAAVLGYHAAMLAVVLWQRGSLAPNVWRAPRVHEVALAVAFGAGAGGFLFLMWPWLGTPADAAFLTVDIGLTMTAWPLYIAYFVAVNALLEEHFWRGCLGSDRKGIVLNDALFAGYHLLVLAGRVSPVWLAAAFVALTLAAWCWRQFVRRSGRLTVPVLSHAAADAACILVIYWFALRLSV